MNESDAELWDKLDRDWRLPTMEVQDAIDEEYAHLLAGVYSPSKPAMVADAISEMEMADVVAITEALNSKNLQGVGAIIDNMVRSNAAARALAAAQRVTR